MADNLRVKKMIQSTTAVPVCRVHIYKSKDTKEPRSPSASKIPINWAGADQTTGDTPYCVIGKEGKYLQARTKDGPRAAGSSTGWEVLDARVNLTRQWQCSQAMVQIARPLNIWARPEAPPVRPNDIIAIEMGYIKGLDTKVSLPNGNTNYDVFAGDCVFYGMVDTVKERGGSGEKDGIVVSILARDMCSYLVDNKIRGQYRPNVLAKYNRAFIIRDLIWRGAAIEHVEWQLADDGKSYKLSPAGLRVPVKVTQNGEELIKPAKFSESNCYLRIGTLEKSQRDEVKIPEESNQYGIALMDKFPLDVIKHFSLIETAPRELWADPKTGNINWMFRRTDARRLIKNPDTRQYFYLYPPERANISSYTFEWSTAGTITHFTLTNPLASSTNEKKTAEIYAESPTAILFDPHTHEPLRPITRNRFVYDDTLVGDDGKNEVIVQSLFNIWGRAIEAGMVMVPGDPSLNIGEAVQIFNTGLFGRRYHEADPKTLVNEYNPDNITDPNPEGIYRVEAITHLFAIGGVANAYKSVFVVGPVDTNTGAAETKRLMQTDADWKTVQRIDINDMIDNGNYTEPPAAT